MTEELWWGYLHIKGTIQVKRYWGDKRDIDDARESDFVDIIVFPFPAKDREEAIIYITNYLKKYN